MDAARIEWKYEPEGFYVADTKYLPDFWISSTGQWGEVKGQLDIEDFIRLSRIASEMTECGQADMVVMGNIPRHGSCLWPVQLHKHGDLWAVPWDLEPGCPLDRPRLKLNRIEPAMAITLLLDGFPSGVPVWGDEPLAKARSARFEFGETPRR